MVVADAKQSLTITGNGDVLEPHDGIIGKKFWQHFGVLKTQLAFASDANRVCCLLQQLAQEDHMHLQLHELLLTYLS